MCIRIVNFYFPLQMRESSQVLSVSTLVFSTLVQAEEPFNDPSSSSGSLQHLAPKNLDRLEDTGAVTKIVATGENGGQPSEYKHKVDKHDLFIVLVLF